MENIFIRNNDTKSHDLQLMKFPHVGKYFTQ